MENELFIFLSSAGFSISVFLFMVLLVVIYYRKKNEDTKVSELFEFLMKITFIPLTFETISYGTYSFMSPSSPNKEKILEVFNTLFLILAAFWTAVFMYYVIKYFKNLRNETTYIDKKKELKERLIFYTIAILSCSFLMAVLPYEVTIIEKSGAYILNGTAPAILNISFFCTVVALLIIAIINRKKAKNLYIAPYIVIFVLYIVLVGLGRYAGYWTNNLASFMGLIVTIMFFTTESQDIKLLDGYNKAKEIENKTTASKQKMLVNMSHEIRSPMHNILGYSDLILNSNNLSKEEYQENLEEIKKGTLELKDTITNIYDISNIETTANRVNQILYDSRKLYQNINNFANRKLVKENTRFTMNVDENIPNMLYGDEEKIYKIITKLIENAIDTTNYGEVKLNVTSKQLDYEFIEQTFTINNSGHVMSQELFDMNYEQFMSSDINNVNYIKLGVIIAKKYVEIIGGTIEFVNEENNGTRYTITIRQKIINTSSN